MTNSILVPIPDEISCYLPRESFKQITATIFMNGKVTDKDIQETIPYSIRTHSQDGPAATRVLEHAAADLISTWLQKHMYAFVRCEFKRVLTNHRSGDNSFFEAINAGSYKDLRRWWATHFFDFDLLGRNRMFKLLVLFREGVHLDLILKVDLSAAEKSYDKQACKKREAMVELQGWCNMLLSSTCANIMLATQNEKSFMKDDPDWKSVTEKLGSLRKSLPSFNLTWRNLSDPAK